MISTAYISFSLFGLLFIFVGGLLITSLALSMEHIAAFIQRTLKLDPYRRLEWASNSFLQLQRMAHEELNVGTWARGDETIPLTKELVSLARLDVLDEKYPKLSATIYEVTKLEDEDTAGKAQVNHVESRPKDETVTEQTADLNHSTSADGQSRPEATDTESLSSPINVPSHSEHSLIYQEEEHDHNLQDQSAHKPDAAAKSDHQRAVQNN